eukprot:590504-Prymnesium_polylepis.1
MGRKHTTQSSSGSVAVASVVEAPALRASVVGPAVAGPELSGGLPLVGGSAAVEGVTVDVEVEERP